MDIESLKSKEIPGGIKVVIADDEERMAAWTNEAWVSVLQAGSSPTTAEVITATSGDDLFAKALGLLDRPADVVVLDDQYQPNNGGWKPTEEMLSLIAQKRGVALDPIKKPDRGNWSVSGVMPDDLYHPNSTHFAIILRYLGFSGTIIVASGGPPDPEYIEQEIRELNKHLSSFGVQVAGRPINGVVTKPSRDNKSYFATNVGRWGWEYTEVEANDYSNAFKALITAL